MAAVMVVVMVGQRVASKVDKMVEMMAIEKAETMVGELAVSMVA